MKSAIKSAVIIILGIIIIMMISTTHGRMNRSMEVKSSLSQAMESTLTQMKLTKSYDISNVNEFVADFTQGLAYSVDSVTDISTKVTNIDKDKGLLSICVTGTFPHPNGNEGTVSENRTIIFHKIPEEIIETYKVKFYINKGDTLAYKEYAILEDDYITIPVAPTKEGASFAGWTSDAGYSMSEPVSCDMEFYAIWH